MKPVTITAFYFSDIAQEFLEPAGADVEALREELGDHFTWGTNKASLVGLTAFCDAMREVNVDEDTIRKIAAEIGCTDSIDLEG